TVAGPSDRVDAGDKVNYGFSVTNTGNVTLTGVKVTDPLTGLDCPIGTLAPSDTDTHCTASHTLTRTDVDAGSLSNTATATGTPPQTLGDVTASDTATVTLPAAPSLDLKKSATLDQTVVAPQTRVDAGDKVDYAFVVTNTGNVTLTVVKVTDP